jgi:hypothetical protein
MSFFKNKPNKLKYLTNVKTLDELHREYMNNYINNKDLLPEKYIQLENLTKDLEEIDKNKYNFTIDDIHKKAQIKSEINVLKDDINKLEQDDDIKEYFSKTGDILLDYYQITSGTFYNIDENEITEKEIDNNNYASDNNKLDSLKLLNKLSQSKRKIKKPVKKRKFVEEIINNKNIFNFFPNLDVKVEKQNEEEIKINRASLQDKYLMLVDGNYKGENNKKCKIKWCYNCDIEKILIQTDGCYVCQQCGEIENSIIETEIPNHKDIINDKQKYPYKKINHLKEKLNQFQAKETIDITQKVYDVIENELKQKRIANADITPYIIKKILRKYKFTEYYEHLQQIYCNVSGNPPIVINKEVEEQIYSMFNNMQEAYIKYMPQNRSNFLNYSYVLNKIFKILNMPKHAKYFSLLKSKDKLREQDIIWNKICKEMNWKYYASNTKNHV